MQKFLLVLYIKVQQDCDFVLLSKHIAIMWKSPEDFPKLKILRVLVYLLKQKFQFSINGIFIAIYGVLKLKIFPTKNCR